MRLGESMNRNKDRDQLIKKLFADRPHLSHANIADLVSKTYAGTTRSVVNGVLFRANMIRGKKNPPTFKQPRATKPKVHRIRIVSSDVEPAYIGPVGDFPPDNGCQYIAKDITPDFQMCGHPSEPDTHYCAWHIEHRHLKQIDGRTSEGRAQREQEQLHRLSRAG